METAKIAMSISGEKKYQVRARAALPILVRQAHAGSTISYTDLAAELEMQNPRNLNFVLGSVGQALKDLSIQWGLDVPPIQCLVINKESGLPGEGVGWFISDKVGPWGSAADYRKLPKANQRRLVEAALQMVFTFTRWFEVLQVLGVELPRFDYNDIVLQASNFRSGPESEEHLRLKEYVARNPQLLGLSGQLIGEIEFSLPSGDTADVLFRKRSEWVAAEVKSRISTKADIVRGLFQCVKYRAVMEAFQVSSGLPQGARSVLVLQAEFPNQLVPLKNILGLDVVDCVEPR